MIWRRACNIALPVIVVACLTADNHGRASRLSYVAPVVEVRTGLQNSIEGGNSSFSAAQLAKQYQEGQKCLEFLKRHLPERDRGHFGTSFLNRHIELALQARRAHHWTRAVPFDIFLNNVLPYASLSEQREQWRRVFYQELSPQVAGAKGLLEAANHLNQYIWGRWRIRHKADEPPDSEVKSPSQVIASGCASSVSMGIFLVNALRSVGIPAHITGTMSWKAAGGNHVWVEVWSRGAWSFMDPGEYRPINDTWFYPYPARLQVTGSQEHSIVAAMYEKRGFGFFPMAWDPDDRQIPGLDVTTHYL